MAAIWGDRYEGGLGSHWFGPPPRTSTASGHTGWPRPLAMRILLVNQYYPRDLAPTGWALHGLARALVARGHDVDVVCSRRAYGSGESYPRREDLDGVHI